MLLNIIFIPNATISFYIILFSLVLYFKIKKTFELLSGEDYTAQLAEVHSMMTTFSRRMSSDIDLCQMDVIGAIDNLVEKMAFELQQGTLSTSDVMHE